MIFNHFCHIWRAIFEHEILANKWVKFHNIEGDKAVLLFIFNRSKPFNYRFSSFPLIHVSFGYYFLVDAVENLLAYFTYLWFGWVDQMT